MISICIPVFNYDVVDLVTELSKQLTDLGDKIEILVADDASATEAKVVNASIDGMLGVRYIELEHNLGRAAIRNFLAEEAQHKFLLFIDADSEIASGDFIARYIEACREAVVICGGTSYKPPPTDTSLMLRYTYGIHREERSLNERLSNPYASFTAHNFCIERKLFLAHRFDEKIKSYGHEDTLLGLDLKKAGVKILHIDNPLFHIGLESAKDFIQKTNTGLENLLLLMKRREDSQEIAGQVKVLRYYFKVKRLGLRAVIAGFYSLFNGVLMANLTSNSPNLKYFDAYKLGYLCKRGRALKI